MSRSATWWKPCLLGLVCIIGAGCASTPKSRPADSDAWAQPVPYPFRAAHVVSPLSIESGRYPNLFAPSSYGVLVTSDVLRMKAEDAARANSAVTAPVDSNPSYDRYFWVVELHLESAFPDMSIAYDVVGLRNMTVYLLTPNGERLMPLQRIPGSSASEEPVGALRRFGRTNLIIFPKRDMLSGDILLDASAPSLKLIIEGFSSQFSLEWAALPPEPLEAPLPMPESDRLTVMRNNLSEFYQDLRTMIRMAQ